MLLESKSLPLGTPIIDFKLPDPEGNMHSPKDFKKSKVLVIIFMCNHCPYVQAVQERLISLQKNFDTKDVQFIGINANDWEEYPADSPEMMKKTIVDWGINFPYLYDETQQTARAYQAQCTPDIYVFDERRTLAYHGRIDDNPALTKREAWGEPEKVTKQELKQALDELLAGNTPAEVQYPTIGCSIKWKA